MCQLREPEPYTLGSPDRERGTRARIIPGKRKPRFKKGEDAPLLLHRKHSAVLGSGRRGQSALWREVGRVELFERLSLFKTVQSRVTEAGKGAVWIKVGAQREELRRRTEQTQHVEYPEARHIWSTAPPPHLVLSRSLKPVILPSRFSLPGFQVGCWKPKTLVSRPENYSIHNPVHPGDQVKQLKPFFFLCRREDNMHAQRRANKVRGGIVRAGSQVPHQGNITPPLLVEGGSWQGCANR